jgi:hypothetical protein
MNRPISDRIAIPHSSNNERSEFGIVGADATSAGLPSNSQASTSTLDTELCEMVRSKKKIGEGVVVGAMRLDHWNTFAQNTLVRFASLLRSSLECTSTLTVAPWKLTGDQSIINEVLSLDASEARFDPSLISKLLCELPNWKKQTSLILLDLGRINSDVARSVAPWCDVTLVLSHSSVSLRPQDSKALRQWRNCGLTLNAAVHVV